ncbi:uncharacterized protein [Epargyreus clarus]|uniref:uncharacterized protein n=1 Tax=Epargyreus clarus TaxID=520877 RepID=UPI003C2FC743
MDANGFIAKLKAGSSEKDVINLDKVFEDYQTILSALPKKDKGTFALNALCVLCRNLDKVPQWRSGVDNKALLVLSIECVRGTRNMEKGDRVKTLACIYHIHRHVVKQNSPTPPELVLKFSYMPFECDDSALLTDYYKTYWSIIADRLTYIERLKANRVNVAKLLPKLTEDLIRVVKIYDTVPFCGNLLVFVVKKLFFIFNDSAKKLNDIFERIFNEISKDVEGFKNVTEKESLDLYTKFNECFVVVTENALKVNFKTSLDGIVRCCIKVLGHSSDIFHCLQTFLLNGFCCIFNSNDQDYVATILKNLIISCETSEKLGYKTVTYATYPFLNQYLKMFIENGLDKVWNVDTQTNCLKFMLLLMRKLGKTTQLLKCENCSVRSGLHDALRLSFLAKNVISAAVNQKIDLKIILSCYNKVIEHQYVILYELRALGCSNFDKCFRKLQTDVHNTAINLNKAQHYEYSIKTFDVYLKNEVKNAKSVTELKNISRGLYNKSICELDSKLHEQALYDAYLSLVLSDAEPSTEKYMSLVMDIKAKMLKIGADDDRSGLDENQDDYQMMTVLNVMKNLLEKNTYGDLTKFVQNLKFSKLLQHEFQMYAKLWPSIVPIAGIWRSLNDMVKEKHNDWLPVLEDRDVLLKMLYEIVIETPSVVRSIHTEYYKEIILGLVEDLEEKSARSFEEDVVLATLLCLKTEYDLTEASEKYGWKTTEHTVDPDLGQAIRTLPQEHHSVQAAMRATEIWIKVIRNIKKISIPLLHNALKIAQVTVQHFLHMQDIVHGLQLSSICCDIALTVGDKESYIRSAGNIISFTDRRSDYIDNMIATASKFVASLMKNGASLEICLIYMCDVAIYYNKIDLVGVAARLVAFVQTRILEAYNKQSNVNLDLSIGRLMEAQFDLLEDRYSVQTILSSVNNIQRHYIAISTNGTTYTTRRLHATLLKYRAASSGNRAVTAAFTQRLYRRARAAAAATLPRAAAVTQAAVYARIVNVSNVEDTQVKIDNRLKHILGLQPTNETQPHCLGPQTNIKHEAFTPKPAHIETMLDNMMKRTQISPSVPCITIPAFKLPDFVTHNPTCTCYACDMLTCDVIACVTCGLEAAMFFRAKEYDIARNYFEGASKVFDLTRYRLGDKLQRFVTRHFDENVLDIVGEVYRREIKRIEIDFLIEASLFELAQGFYERSDDYVVRLYELMSEVTVDLYLKNEIYNLMVASAQLRQVVKTPELGIEIDFDALKISPKNVDEPKTPETKFVPVKSEVKLVRAEELPNVKRKVIKLNLDDNPDDDVKIKPSKPHFKVPIPVTSKPIFENVTPRPRLKPDITVTDIENTPNTEFFTPQSTPNELFFTPMSVKTYGKVVKNLEAEFSTPKSVRRPLVETKNEGKTKSESKKVADGPKKTDPKGKVEKGSIKTLRDKRTLKRATSPGKLGKEEKTVTRSRRRNLLEDNAKV